MLDIQEEIKKRKAQRRFVGNMIIKVACSTFMPRVKLKNTLMTTTIISGIRK